MPNEQRNLKVFLCHSHSDKNAVHDLYQYLTKSGVNAWLDREVLVGGQDWEYEIRKAVRESDVVVVCLSRHFTQKGYRQNELRIALDEANSQPEGTIFIIPLRLEECEVPQSLHRWQWVDLFEDDGYDRLLRALQKRAEDIGVVLRQRGWLLRNTAPRPKAKEQIRGEAVVNTEKPGKMTDLGKAQHGEQRRYRKLQSTVELPKAASRRNTSSKSFSKFYFFMPVALVAILGIIVFKLIGQQPPATPPSTPTATFTPTVTDTPTPTLTATSTEPTFTLLPATETSIPTFTPVPPVPLEKDWMAGCISTLWKPYPPNITAMERDDGCWKEPVHVFSAENGDLDFLAKHSGGPAEIYGLFAPLPERGAISLRIRLRKLENVDLWMGVFAEPDVKSQGLLMIIPSGDIKKRPFVFKDSSSYETIASSSMLYQGNGYTISFSFTENSVKSTVNPSVFVTIPVPISSPQKWLFLGYKGLGGSYRIDGTFLSFELE